MTFARVRISGGWTFDSAIDGSELEQIDENLSHAIDGEDGGTWNPSAAINIGGGYGLKVAAPFETSGTATIKNGLTISTAGVLDCQRAATFKAGLTINTAGTFSCTRSAAFDGGVLIDTAGTFVSLRQGYFSAGLQIDTAGSFSCSRPSTFTGQLTIGNATNYLSGNLILAGSGKVVQRLEVLPGGNQSRSVDDADEFRAPQTTLGTTTLTIGNTGAVLGSRIRVSRKYVTATSGPYAVEVNGSNSYDLGDVTTGNYIWIEFTYSGSAWFVSGGHQVP